MGKYILKRIALAIVTIWAVATITFFLMNLVPGGPFLSEKAISPAATKALEAKYGLDKPMAERYFTYISDAAHGDFGDSLKQRGRTVMDIIATKFPVSARLGGMAVVLALCVGVPLGVLAAYKRGTFIIVYSVSLPPAALRCPGSLSVRCSFTSLALNCSGCRHWALRGRRATLCRWLRWQLIRHHISCV